MRLPRAAPRRMPARTTPDCQSVPKGARVFASFVASYCGVEQEQLAWLIIKRPRVRVTLPQRTLRSKRKAGLISPAEMVRIHPQRR